VATNSSRRRTDLRRSLPPGDNLMLQAAIYRANPGDIIVVEAGNSDYAMSDGNVCAMA